MRILNLYAGLGGNRSLWGNEHDITAIELSPFIAGIYLDRFKNDNVIVADAHEYLEKHFAEYDFIWTSPPCPTHSKLIHNTHKIFVYPDMKLWQEILLLKGINNEYPNIKWVVENVIMWYEPLIAPSIKLQRHYFWSNFDITALKVNKYLTDNITTGTIKEKEQNNDIDLSKYDIPENIKDTCLNNCVNRFIGRDILNCALKKNIQVKF